MSERLLMVPDVMKLWQCSRASVERANIPRTIIKGAPRLVRFHPRDVETHQQREKIKARVTREMVAALGAAQPFTKAGIELVGLYDILTQIVGEE